MYPGVAPNRPPKAWASSTAMSHVVHETGVSRMVTSSNEANTGPREDRTRLLRSNTGGVCADLFLGTARLRSLPLFLQQLHRALSLAFSGPPSAKPSAAPPDSALFGFWKTSQ